MVGTECKEKGLSPEEWGVGRAIHQAGIYDAPYGIMMVAPGEYVEKYFFGIRDLNRITPRYLRQCILSYYI